MDWLYSFFDFASSLSNPAISGDGRCIAFNIVPDVLPGDTNEASDVFVRAHPVARPDGDASKQQAFVDGIKASGQHWAPFDTLDGLCRTVLRDGWSLEDRPLPAMDAPTREALATSASPA